jgi:hypothetical protein
MELVTLHCSFNNDYNRTDRSITNSIICYLNAHRGLRYRMDLREIWATLEVNKLRSDQARHIDLEWHGNKCPSASKGRIKIECI